MSAHRFDHGLDGMIAAESARRRATAKALLSRRDAVVIGKAPSRGWCPKEGRAVSGDRPPGVYCPLGRADCTRAVQRDHCTSSLGCSGTCLSKLDDESFAPGMDSRRAMRDRPIITASRAGIGEAHALGRGEPVADPGAAKLDLQRVQARNAPCPQARLPVDRRAPRADPAWAERHWTLAL